MGCACLDVHTKVEQSEEDAADLYGKFQAVHDCLDPVERHVRALEAEPSGEEGHVNVVEDGVEEVEAQVGEGPPKVE